MTAQERIEALLLATEREGMQALLEYLRKEGFYTSPASTRYHGCYTGGLADHSLRLYELVIEFNETLKLGATPTEIAIGTLLHDVCKIGAYRGLAGHYSWNRQQPKGHALLSLIRVSQYIKLEPIEELMIRFHMGVYGLNEFEPGKGEYALRGDKSNSKEERRGKSLANAWFHYPITKITYFCDELATFEEKAKEGIEP